MNESGGIILVVASEKPRRAALLSRIASLGHTALEVESRGKGLAAFEKAAPDLVVWDLDTRGGAPMLELQARFPGVPIIAAAGDFDAKRVLEAMRNGAWDCLLNADDTAELRQTVERALKKRRLEKTVAQMEQRREERRAFFRYMGQSDAMHTLADAVEKASSSSLSVFIEGESGSGKEVVAKAIHNQSSAKDGPFVVADCGVSSGTSVAGDVFSADSNKTCLFAMAGNGTLFLNNVANLSYPAQENLILALRDQRATRPPVRVIAAAARPLEKFVGDLIFRADLCQELCGIVITIPALRLRPEDLFCLAGRFLSEAQTQLGKSTRGFSRQALERMFAHSWPENARELQSAVFQAVLACGEGDWITPDHLALGEGFSFLPETENVFSQPRFDEALPGPLPFIPLPVFPGAENIPLAERVKTAAAEIERDILRDALLRAGGNKMKTSKMLQTDYKTLLRKIKRYGL